MVARARAPRAVATITSSPAPFTTIAAYLPAVSFRAAVFRVKPAGPLLEVGSTSGYDRSVGGVVHGREGCSLEGAVVAERMIGTLADVAGTSVLGNFIK